MGSPLDTIFVPGTIVTCPPCGTVSPLPTVRTTIKITSQLEFKRRTPPTLARAKLFLYPNAIAIKRYSIKASKEVFDALLRSA